MCVCVLSSSSTHTRGASQLHEALSLLEATREQLGRAREQVRKGEGEMRQVLEDMNAKKLFYESKMRKFQQVFTDLQNDA